MSEDIGSYGSPGDRAAPRADLKGGEAAFTKGPWTWADFGRSLMLVTAWGGSRVVLSAHNGDIQTRDANGTLRSMTADHPNALLIKAAPEMYRYLEIINRIASPNPERTFDGVIRDLDAITDMARAALAKARGER